MIIYGALIISIITTIILYFYFKHKTVWWEFFVPLLITFILILISKFTIEKIQVTCNEYWGSFVDRIEYYEDWNEYINQTCTRTCCCDSKGSCGTETYDCSYVQYHPPVWKIITTTNESIEITQNEYNNIKNKLGNEKFIELNRPSYTDDGDEYYCSWNKDSTTSIPVTTLHYYENRIKAADQSVFHFGKVNKDDIKKYDLKDYSYIVDDYKMSSVIGDNSNDAKLADEKIQYLNGLFGHLKQVRIFVLIYKNQPIDAALYQEWYWFGGNMNEFVICIGIDNERNVKWCKPISWTRNEVLKADVKNFIQNQNKLNFQLIVDFIQKNISKGFERRNFKEFNYLTVEPPTWAIIFVYILTILVNIGLSYWIINNEYED